MPTLSVIIPTRDRPAMLRDCLTTLQSQQAGSDALEVVVIDDGSTADLAAVVSQSEGPVPVRCIRQAPQGLNAARNRGTSETTGELVAFLDDDTLVSPRWATAIMAAFERHECAGLAGRVQLEFECQPPAWLRTPQRNYLAELDLGDHACWLDSRLVPVGANCAVRRIDADRVGGFRAGLDRDGGSLISNGDTEFFRRLRAAGGRLRYEPAAHVLHRVTADRLTRSFFKRRAFAQGISDIRVSEAEAPRAHPVAMAREVWRTGRTVPILLRGITTGSGTMNAVQWVNYCRGRWDATTRPRG